MFPFYIRQVQKDSENKSQQGDSLLAQISKISTNWTLI